MWDAKSFTITVQVFFSTPFLSSHFFLRTAKSSYNELLLRKRETKIRPTSLATQNKVCVTNAVVICDACDPCNAMCFTLFMVTSIHNIRKYTKIRNSKKRWKVTQDSRLKRQRNQLDKYKSLKENRKDVQRKKLIDPQGESNINMVAEVLVSSENTAS